MFECSNVRQPSGLSPMTALSSLAGSYHPGTPWMSNEADLEQAVRSFQQWLEATPRMGLWIDSSAQTAEETVDEILARWDEALIP